MNNKRFFIFLLVILFIPIHFVSADDIEVYSTDDNLDAPNVLFALDTSGSMTEVIDESTGKTRMQALQESMITVLSQNYQALNVGVLNFAGTWGGGIDFPVVDIKQDAHNIDSDIPKEIKVSQVIIHLIQGYDIDGQTPLGDAIFRAQQYYSGQKLANSYYNSRPKSWDTEDNKYTGGAGVADHPASYGNVPYYTSIPGTEYLDENAKCTKTDSGETNCLGDNISNLSCTTLTGKPAYCRLHEEKCDITGTECSSTYKDVSKDHIIPDEEDRKNGGSFYLSCFGNQADYERCRADIIKTKSGFETRPSYKSPIAGQCQKNYLVILGDGEPTSRLDSFKRKVSKIVYPDQPWAGNYNHCEDVSNFGEPILTDGVCLPDLVKYMRDVDQAPDIVGDQTITTYTVGFALSGEEKAQEFLRLLSDENHGQGKYFDANSPEELVSVFQEIINEVVEEEKRFVSPLVSVSRNDRLATNDSVFLTSFIPGKTPSWKGDIKRYNVDTTGIDSSPSLNLSSVITNSRTVYTYTGSYPIVSNVDLTRNQFRVDSSNNELTLSLLGLGDDDTERRNDIIDWVNGQDVTDIDNDGNVSEAHQRMGDSLHTKPALVSYAENRDVLYSMTNDGFLHAFDVTQGNSAYEIFSFIPQTLLKNLNKVFNNLNSDSKSYGLDGGITVWQTPSKVILILGMRRGGSNYYALDVTDPTKPELQWVIQGGENSTDFEKLGQTWSTPLLTNVKHDDVTKMALVFGGGYDTSQDSNDRRINDDTGNAIYIVDAENGRLLWSAGRDNQHTLKLSQMKHSIPSNIRAIDFDGDSLSDRLYFGDTGGKVWRIDLDTKNIENSVGYLLADFNDHTKLGNRRFYSAPSVAITRKGKLKIAIGSGYRAHPLAQGVQDRLYVFEDVNSAIGVPEDEPEPLKDADLLRVTSTSDGKVNWFVDLAENEKALSEPLIFNHKVIFTTYQPKFSGGGDLCDISGAQTRAYFMALTNGDSTISKGSTTRATLMETQNIPDSPYVVFNKAKTTASADHQVADVFVGMKKIDQVSGLNERIFWKKDQ